MLIYKDFGNVLHTSCLHGVSNDKLLDCLALCHTSGDVCTPDWLDLARCLS